MTSLLKTVKGKKLVHQRYVSMIRRSVRNSLTFPTNPLPFSDHPSFLDCRQPCICKSKVFAFFLGLKSEQSLHNKYQYFKTIRTYRESLIEEDRHCSDCNTVFFEVAFENPLEIGYQAYAILLRNMVSLRSPQDHLLVLYVLGGAHNLSIHYRILFD